MNKLFVILTIVFLLTPCLKGQKVPYLAGEKVTYSIHYGIINAGTASLELKNDSIEGQTVLHSVFSGRTTGIIDALYKVRDTFEEDIPVIDDDHPS